MNFICNRCHLHELADCYYMKQKNNTLHLCGYCPLCGHRFLPFIPNLELPIKKSKKSSEKKKDTLTLPSLFSPLDTESQ